MDLGGTTRRARHAGIRLEELCGNRDLDGQEPRGRVVRSMGGKGLKFWHCHMCLALDYRFCGETGMRFRYGSGLAENCLAVCHFLVKISFSG
jgi:hypothetical protein